MTNRSAIITIVVVLLLAVIAGGGYWYYLSQPHTTGQTGGTSTTGGFIPLNRSGSGSGQGGTTTGGGQGGGVTISTSTQQGGVRQTNPVPILRLLSNTPVGGYGINTVGTTTFVRWIDRGRGNIYEVVENSFNLTTISNTLLPRVINSMWNASLTTFIGPTLQNNNENPTYIYAALTSTAPNKGIALAATSTRTQQTVTPYELRGKNLPGGTLEYAVSPQKDRVFTLVKNGDNSIGYVANMDGTKATQLFTTPLTQLNVEWPSENIIALTNKGTADRPGYLYFVNPKTGVWKKVLGPVNGLSTKVSHDGKNVFLSVTGTGNDVVSGIYNVGTGVATDVLVRTLAEKCTWGNFYTTMVYCAVPFQVVGGVYPDDWYKGTLSTADKIWQVNAVTGETKLINQVIGKADRVINAFNLNTDNKDGYLIFENKNDLSLWSLDLVRSN